MKSGFLLINKSAGMSSFGALREVRRSLGIKKIGHAGTLDPFASGLLVVAIGNATKALSHLILSEKTYRTKIIFGVTSDTLDTEGLLSYEKITPELKKEQIQKKLTSFLGEQDQLPPKYSALKINGKRACDRMREGEEVELKSRKVIMHENKLLDFGPEQINTLEESMYPYADIFLRVGSGFYVRSFARDLSASLNTVGICTELHRESVGGFSITNAKSPDNITEADILPIKPEYFSLPSLILPHEHLDDFFHGRQIQINVPNGDISIFGAEGKWLGFGLGNSDILAPKKVIR